jgi:hypothetical protein
VKTIYKCSTALVGANQLIGYTSDQALAARLVVGRGEGPSHKGEIDRIAVWETPEDLPPDVFQQMTAEEAKRTSAIDKCVQNFTDLLEGLSPAERIEVLKRIR